MTRRGTIGWLLLALALAGCSTAHASAPGHPTSTASSAATQRVTVRPVTPAGTPAAGYTVLDRTSQSLDCSLAPNASPVSLSAGVLWCSPTVAYAVACWPSSHSSVLCLLDARQHTLTRYATTGVTHPARTAHPVPLNVVLAGGTHCSLRNGGAWSPLEQHPTWVGWYWCSGNQAVWGAPGSQGLDTSQPGWTVQLGAQSGTGAVRTVAVTAAYFVATAA